MSSTEIKALIDLLLDDDPRTRTAVAERLSSIGQEGLSALREAQEADDPRLRLRARRLLWELETRAVGAELERVAAEPDPDLEEACILLARAEMPDLDPTYVRRELERIAAGLARAALPRQGLLERARALGDHMSGEEGFTGNADDYEDPRNSYVDQVLRRRVGIPISLSAVYILAGRRAGLTLEGVGMPLHFLVSLRDGDERVLLDPYGGGRIMSREACKALLAGFHHSFREDYLRPVSDRDMLRRMIANLVRIYHNRGDQLRLKRLYRVVNVLQDRRANG